MGDKVLQHRFLTVKVRKGVWDSTKSPNCANKITWLAASRQHLQWQIWLVHFNVADRQRVSPPITLDLFLPSLLQTLPLGSLPQPDAWDKSRRFRGNLPSVAAGYIKTLDRPAFSCRRESAPRPFRPGFIDGPWCMRRSARAAVVKLIQRLCSDCVSPPSCTSGSFKRSLWIVPVALDECRHPPPPPSSPHTASQPPSPT